MGGRVGQSLEKEARMELPAAKYRRGPKREVSK